MSNSIWNGDTLSWDAVTVDRSLIYTPPPIAADDYKLGWYTGGIPANMAAHHADWEDRLNGRPCPYSLTWHNGPGSWAAWQSNWGSVVWNWEQQNLARASIGRVPWRPIFSFCPWPFWKTDTNGNPSGAIGLYTEAERQQYFTEANRGDYDAYWRAAATTWVNGDFNTPTGGILRPFWEMNGNWYFFTAMLDYEVFKQIWIRFVSIFREMGVVTPIMYNPIAEGGNRHPDLARPLDAYIDIYALDLYDTYWGSFISEEDRWQVNRFGDGKLQWLVDMQAEYGKPIALGEWGLWADVLPYGGGGDSPYFIEKMHEFIYDYDLLTAVYFDTGASDGDHRLDTVGNPNALAKFINLFGV